MGGMNKDSIGSGTAVKQGNVITSNACISSNNLINSMNSSGRANTNSTSKRKLDEMDNKSDVKKVFFFIFER